jgi:class 3 adenylate cyclase
VDSVRTDVDRASDLRAPSDPAAFVAHRLGRFAMLGVTDEDAEDEQLQKATITLAAALISTMSIVWVATYWSLGLWRSGAIPFTYQLVTVIGLATFARTKRLAPFRSVQLSMMLVLPFLLQISLGGFGTSSAVGLWAFIAPLGALLFQGVRRAMPWFVAFACGTIACGVLEPYLRGEGDIPTSIVIAFYVLNVLGVSATVFLVLRYFMRERERILDALRVEQDRSERLLLNVLPAAIAQRLKKQPGAIAEGFRSVTVLFADIVGFTVFAEAREPDEVVAVLNELFSGFDELADRYGVEKIKTIGDAYMAVAGLPLPRTDHEAAIADMALAMRDEVARFNADTGRELAIRVGIASGPVVAGVIGNRKFSYDVWGDTVNVASRMESHGVVGGIQVTRAVMEALRDRYELEERGSVDVKGKGPTTTYLLCARRSRRVEGPA